MKSAENHRVNNKLLKSMSLLNAIHKLCFRGSLHIKKSTKFKILTLKWLKR